MDLGWYLLFWVGLLLSYSNNADRSFNRMCSIQSLDCFNDLLWVSIGGQIATVHSKCSNYQQYKRNRRWSRSTPARQQEQRFHKHSSWWRSVNLFLRFILNKARECRLRILKNNAISKTTRSWILDLFRQLLSSLYSSIHKIWNYCSICRVLFFFSSWFESRGNKGFTHVCSIEQSSCLVQYSKKN